MKKTAISLAVASVLACIAAPAAAQLKFTGNAAVTGLATDFTGSNRWRFEEYRDLSSGVAGSFDLRAHRDDSEIRLYGDNIGRDDYSVEFSGRKYDHYRYSVYNNKIIHNLTTYARTPFNGIGTDSLALPGGGPPSLNPDTWNRFDYGITHQNTGFTFELSRGSPYYFRTTANYKETEGLRPLGAPGTSPGGPAYELPLPVSFQTMDASAEAGYASLRQQFSINVSYSKFLDGNDFVKWQNAAVTAGGVNQELSTIASDNNQWKVAANALLRQLPMSSTLALRGTYTRLTSSVPVQPFYVSVAAGVGNFRNSGANVSNFDGDITTWTGSASLTSQPLRALDTRIYYNYTDRQNDSTQVVFRPTGAGAGGACDFSFTSNLALPTCTAELFHYQKHNAGIEAGYRIDRANKLTAGLDYTHTVRERHDFSNNTDWKGSLEYKNNTFESVTTRLKYQRLQRTGHWNSHVRGNSFERWMYRFDVAPLDQDLVKIGVDYAPLPLLDLGMDLIYKNNQYKNTFLGRKHDDRQEIYLSASYGDPKSLRLTAFFDAEFTMYHSNHVVGAFPAAFPEGTPTSAAFQWESKIRERSFVFGLAGDWLYREWLKLNGSVIYQHTNGFIDFLVRDAVVLPAKVHSYDTFRRLTLNLNGTAPIQKNLDLTLGAAYDLFKYQDIQFNDYRNVVGTAPGTATLFSGAYASPAYNARIVYATLRYHFK